MSDERKNILVIKLSALGDFVLALGAFKAIYEHHPGARFTLLTTPPYRRIAEASGFIDEIWSEARPRPSKVGDWLSLGRRLRRGKFDRVYDLQRSDRTGWYFRLLGRPKPEWVGTVKGCSHRYQTPPGPKGHIERRQADQLALAGIKTVPKPDLSFMTSDIARFGLPDSIALLVPGGAPHRPAKRWPVDHFAALATWLSERGVSPVLLGTAAEAEPIRRIAETCPGAIDLCDKTDFFDLAALARVAKAAVGNDTGPMHLISAAGCPVISLFSADSDPDKVAPIGLAVTVLSRPNLANLPVDEVLAALSIQLGEPTLNPNAGASRVTTQE